MTCQRCEGLMVLERYDDLELGSAGYEVSAWRCLNCGSIVDRAGSVRSAETLRHSLRHGMMPRTNSTQFIQGGGPHETRK